MPTRKLAHIAAALPAPARRHIKAALALEAELLELASATPSSSHTAFEGGPVTEERRREMLFTDEVFMMARPGQRVAVHLNLGVKKSKYGMKTWSVKPAKGRSMGGETIGHVFSVVLRNAQFLVGQSGWKMVQDKGEKTVHAGVFGSVASSDPPGSGGDRGGVQIRYNPHQGMRWFMRQNPETGDWDIPVESADQVTLAPDWTVWAKGVVDMDPAVAKVAKTPTVHRAALEVASSLPKGDPARRDLLAALRDGLL